MGRGYEIIYDAQVNRHLRNIGTKYYTFIRKEIEKQLSYEPERETNNKKPLRPPSTLGTAWELRFGPENRFRVFYRIDPEQRAVYILAVGMKIKEKLLIGGKEFEL